LFIFSAGLACGCRYLLDADLVIAESGGRRADEKA